MSSRLIKENSLKKYIQNGTFFSFLIDKTNNDNICHALFSSDHITLDLIKTYQFVQTLKLTYDKANNKYRVSNEPKAQNEKKLKSQ